MREKLGLEESLRKSDEKAKLGTTKMDFTVHISMKQQILALLILGYKIDLDEGDVIVTATDGLFDNLYEKKIASAASKMPVSVAQDIAEYLAMRAQEEGRSARVRTPFADAAHAAGYVGYTGGKLDDVTVIVSFVQKRSSSNSQ
ncbi:putative protein phosphatase 2c 62 [Quercus suber]|uniref:Protein phosphatase n=1 Tax=Quercus suber TaxID=58331 RepID=A0AAW0KBI4_QUESU